MPPVPTKVLTITELTRGIKLLLEDRYPSVWIDGEISNLRIPASGHLYFTLKDANAQIAAVMFRGMAASVTFKPRDGLQVLACGEISVSEKSGQYQVVHPSNPVSELTLEQISAIYTGEITNWKELGGEDRPIVLLSRETNSGTHVFFLENVIRRGEKDSDLLFSPDTLLLPSSERISAEVRQNPNAIGYDGLGYVTPDQKTVAVAQHAGEPFVEPSIETENTGTYPIARPLYIYTRGQPTGPIKDFLDWILGEEGQKIVRELGFVDLRHAARCAARRPAAAPAPAVPAGANLTFHGRYRFLRTNERLGFNEIVRVARAGVELGVRKLRLTGGEPLCARACRNWWASCHWSTGSRTSPSPPTASCSRSTPPSSRRMACAASP